LSHLQGKKFEKRPLAEIERDIDTVKKIRDEIVALSWKEGYGGKIAEGFVEHIFSNQTFNECVRSVAVWLYFGAKNVFIQDANSLVMKVDELVEGSVSQEGFSHNRQNHLLRTLADLGPVVVLGEPEAARKGRLDEASPGHGDRL